MLLMVAKLDPDAAKQVQPQDAPPAATDPGGGAKGETPRTSPVASAPKTDKTQAGVSGDSGQGSKGERGPGLGGKGVGAPQAKGGEPHGTEGPGTKPQAQESGERARLVTAQKEGGGDPTSKTAKGTLSKGAGGKEKLTGPPVQARKWGGSLGRRTRGDSVQGKKDRAGEAPEKVGQAQGQAGEVPRVMEKEGQAGGPREELGKGPCAPSQAGEAGAAQSYAVAEGQKVSKDGVSRGESPGAARREGQPQCQGQATEEACPGVEEAAETQPAEKQPAAREEATPGPLVQMQSQQGPALQGADTGGQSGGTSDQVSRL